MRLQATLGRLTLCHLLLSLASGARGSPVLSSTRERRRRASALLHNHAAIFSHIQLHSPGGCALTGSVEASGASSSSLSTELHIGQQRLSQRVLEHPRDCAAQRPGPVGGVVALLEDALLETRGESDLEVPLAKALEDLPKLDLRNGTHVLAGQGPEDDDLIQAVEELGSEEALHLLVHELLHLRVALLTSVIPSPEAQSKAACGALLHRAAAKVGRHDHQRVGEGHGPALGVGEAAVVQQLQEHVEDVGVCLLHLVEEHQRVWPPTQGFCEGAAITVAHIAGRRADELGDCVLLHVLAHVQTDHGLISAKECGSEGLAERRLADSRWPREHEASDRPLGIPESCTGTSQSPRDTLHCLVLADDAAVQLSLQLQEPRRF
mmetsp:Transcript_96585/g.268469  ORF Transcript_96585/g.268469 Transcript_96585/m.268469 type:complete len:379 (-) Transcript_96585:2455-3591(-)